MDPAVDDRDLSQQHSLMRDRASEARCVIRITVRPWATRIRVSAMARSFASSSAEVGSSSTSTFGLASKAGRSRCAGAHRRKASGRVPRGRSRSLGKRQDAIVNRGGTGSLGDLLGSKRQDARKRCFREPRVKQIWRLIHQRDARRRSAKERSRRLWPSSRMAPDPGSWKRSRRSAMVDLPAPLGPRIAQMAAGFDAQRKILSRTGASAWRKETQSNSISPRAAGSGMGCAGTGTSGWVSNSSQTRVRETPPETRLVYRLIRF